MVKKLLLPLIVVATAAQVSAAVVLWDGNSNTNVVTGNLAFAGGFTPNVTTHTASKAYSLVTPMLVNANYTGPQFFGGIYTFAEDDVVAGGVPSGVVRNDTPEIIRLQSTLADADVSMTLRGALLFSTAGIGSGLSFADIPALSIDARLAIGNDTGVELRWVAVGNGGTYVSDATAGLTTVMESHTLASTQSINWASWTPGADMALGSLTYDVAGGSITGITHVGFYLGIERSGANSQGTFDMASFSVIPEPSTYALIGGILALGVVMLRRRRA